ncbi:TPA: ketol-acid reductoisomerase [Candidatus Woesearchaeota archaeon]|nr:ketol-acid reductoisomerase [Candidatus Woesearchaeota archaeon]HII68861.1 ketol-acid reductoisomerase [Candidatus Woesearchaeota archaeon]
MVNLLYDKDANLDAVKGRTIAVIGYGAQGRAQSLCMKDSGLSVIVGVRKNGASWKKAQEEGLAVAPIAEAAKKADIIHILIPDECQKVVYDTEIRQHTQPGKTLSWSHGFNVCFRRIVPPQGVDAIMIAPKAPGTEVRKLFLQGFGTPGLISVKQDASGKAKAVALALAKACGLTRAGVLQCTFEQETYEDLFGEQTVLCGGCVELVKAGFETLTEAGYPAEMAYFECLHELKLIVDLMYEGGIQRMAEVISNTAEYGMWSVGHKIITPDVKQRMKEALKRIESGEFAKQWIAEYEKGMPTLKKAREDIGKHEIERVGREIRRLFVKTL